MSEETPKKKRDNHAIDPAKKPKKTEKTLLPGSIAPRNAVEAKFFAAYGTVTPIPENTHRRQQHYITAAILYIHQNKTILEIAEMVDMAPESLRIIKREDEWDQFKQTLMQTMAPSTLALFEPHDFEKISEERKRREEGLPGLIEADSKLINALPNMVPGSLMQATAIANIEKIRKLISNIIGLDAHTMEQHGARKTALSRAAANFAGGDVLPAQKQVEGTILDV